MPGLPKRIQNVTPNHQQMFKNEGLESACKLDTKVWSSDPLNFAGKDSRCSWSIVFKVWSLLQACQKYVKRCFQNRLTIDETPIPKGFQQHVWESVAKNIKKVWARVQTRNPRWIQNHPRGAQMGFNVDQDIAKLDNSLPGCPKGLKIS